MSRARPLALAALLVVACAASACGELPARTGADRSGPDLSAPPSRLPDTAFARLVGSLSEPGGYFDTDNLISNETSYLHVLGALERLGVGGGAYVGVGPDQSFAYMAKVRPSVAFIVDIRRDNLLQHLLFKALFALAPTRAEYLALLLGRPLPDDPRAWRDASVDALVERFDTLAADERSVARARAAVDSVVGSFGLELGPDDRATIDRFHRAFMDEGLALRFRSHGRAPRPYYPTLRQLLLERDLEGRSASYLADAEDYRFLRALQAANQVVPVVGDLAGDHALRAVGEEIARRGERLSVLYASNVEFYLWRDGGFGGWVRNVEALPWDRNGVLVRSYFPSFYGLHPHAVPGHHSTQTLQTAASFLRTARGEGWASYMELVTRDAVDPRPHAGAEG